MAAPLIRLVVDCSTVVKLKVGEEEHATEAREMLQDWHAGAVEVWAPALLPGEIMSAFTRAVRRDRISDAAAREAIQELVSLPFHLVDMAPLALRAYELAQAFNQRTYDCFYGALAERENLELWTGDRRLCNALQDAFPWCRWIGDYARNRS